MIKNKPVNIKSLTNVRLVMMIADSRQFICVD